MRKQFNKNFAYLLVAAIAVFFLVFIGILIFSANFFSNNAPLNNQPTTPIGNSAQCSTYGGTWLDSYSECENISDNQCSQMNGKFNDCASPCRHSAPGIAACIQSCVQVCSL